jgi:hypothetical protein
MNPAAVRLQAGAIACFVRIVAGAPQDAHAYLTNGWIVVNDQDTARLFDHSPASHLAPSLPSSSSLAVRRPGSLPRLGASWGSTAPG